ncbi:MAG TPA: glycoside hydrolase family 13 protein [Streptosporangiaceae bacterium]|nr:glycoside hydrolase family 13 protein [Streptosporangiaceae bacterium]
MAPPTVAPVPAAPDPRPWWRDAVIYQVYVRSFAAGPGPHGATGVGNLAGVRSRLSYLAALGVDAIWFNPWYPSPMADAGYDVADYRTIDPLFGTLDEAEKLIAEAHELGIRMILDVVPNHGSDVHPWFTAALAAPPGSPERDRYIFRPGRGEHGELPPNNWISEFGGPAWTRATGPDGQPGEWYLHLFTPEQPDFNWGNRDVQAEFEDVLRFWFDRGVDGFRIDSAVLLAKDPAMADYDPDGPGGADAGVHPFVDRDEVHDVYRAWRRIADSYPGDRVLIGEVWLPDVERTTRYLRPGELQTVFNFDFLRCPWDGRELRSVIDATLASHAEVDAPATWVLSNHDVIRNVTRYGRADTSFDRPGHRIGEPTDLVLGTRRARAAALLSLSLPGTAYVYQGEELGLWEVEDIPDADRQDPMWQRSGHQHLGRDGCRVPLPWSGDQPPFGFLANSGGSGPGGSGPDGSGPGGSGPGGSGPGGSGPDGDGRRTWLPQPPAWAGLTVEAEDANPDSMLSLYRHVLAVRHREPAFATDSFTWLPGPADVLCYRRGADVTVMINVSGQPAELPPHEEILAASHRVSGEVLPPGTGVWLRTRPPAS